MLKPLLIAALLLLHGAAQAAERIVALSPDVAELVLALQAQGQLVGRDSLARQPALAQVPVIGSSRTLTAAPILALRPTLVLGSDQAQPPAIFDQLQRLGLRVERMAHSEQPQAFAAGIVQLGTLLGRRHEATQLAQRWQQALQPASSNGKRYLLSYDGRMVAGSGTAGDALIRAAGGINAAAAVQGMLPMTAEAWLRAAPDVVIVAEHNAPVYGGLAALQRRPELAGSPAVRQQRVYAWPARDFLRLGVDSPAVVQRLRQLS